MKIAYSVRSAPTARKLAEQGDIELVRSSNQPVLVNWGRAIADAELNPNIGNSTDKGVMRQLFEEHEVPSPAPVSISDLRSDLARGIPRKVVGRSDTHSKGRGFWLCRSSADVSKALRGTRLKKPATHFMEYIDAPHELRIHIFKGKSIRISEKLFSGPGSYTTIKPTVEVKQARKAAKLAVRALGLDFAAVDVLVMEDGTPFVLECNAAPGLGGSMPQLYAEVFKQYEEGDWND